MLLAEVKLPKLDTLLRGDKYFAKCRHNSNFLMLPNRDSVWLYFLNKCSENLHIVLSMSPSGESLRNRCRNFPGLVGNTSIDWIFPWPEQALFSVATKYLGEHPSISEMYKRDIVEHVVHVHNSVRHYTQQYLQSVRRKNFVTPKHYLDFISTYLRLIGLYPYKHSFFVIFL